MQALDEKIVNLEKVIGTLMGKLEGSKNKNTVGKITNCVFVLNSLFL